MGPSVGRSHVAKDRNVYICPANKILTTTGKLVNDGEILHAPLSHAQVSLALSQLLKQPPSDFDISTTTFM
jgi:hypothetical protein